MSISSSEILLPFRSAVHRENLPRVSYVQGHGKPSAGIVRMLRSIAVHFDVHSRLDAVVDEGPLQLVVLDLDSLPDGELDALEQMARRCRVLLISERSDPQLMADLFKRRILTNLVAGGSDADVEDLRVTIQKLLRRDLFGIEKYFGWGVEARRYTVRHSPQRAEVTDAAEQFADYMGAQKRFVHMFRTVVDELLTNALYNAPVDASGRPRFRHIPRDSEVSLDPGERIEVVFASDGRRLATSTTDSFGSLSEDTVRQHMCRHLGTHLREVQTTSGGAGLGLAFLYDSLSQLIINLEPGRRTEMIGVLHADGTYRDFLSRRKGFNLFVAEPRRDEHDA